jgi:predicted nucleic acid-binding protein
VTYLDTSVLAAVFFREATAAAVAAGMRRHAGEGLLISAWTLTEMASVGAIKARTGAVTPTTRGEAMEAFQRFASTELRVIELEAIDFRAAARLIEHSENLRAGDALHLAVAQRVGAALATLDARMATAARAVGLAVWPVAG